MSFLSRSLFIPPFTWKHQCSLVFSINCWSLNNAFLAFMDHSFLLTKCYIGCTVCSTRSLSYRSKSRKKSSFCSCSSKTFLFSEFVFHSALHQPIFNAHFRSGFPCHFGTKLQKLSGRSKHILKISSLRSK